jgi:hypothetical protein
MLERSMPAQLSLFVTLRHCFFTAIPVLLDLVRLVSISFRARRALATENLFLRKQLALFQEPKVKLRRADDSTRWIVQRQRTETITCGMTTKVG